MGAFCFYSLLQVWLTFVQFCCIAANRYLLNMSKDLPTNNWGCAESICSLQYSTASKYPKGQAKQVCNSKVIKTKGKILPLVNLKIPANTFSSSTFFPNITTHLILSLYVSNILDNKNLKNIIFPESSE